MLSCACCSKQLGDLQRRACTAGRALGRWNTCGGCKAAGVRDAPVYCDATGGGLVVRLVEIDDLVGRGGRARARKAPDEGVPRMRAHARPRHRAERDDYEAIVKHAQRRRRGLEGGRKALERSELP